MTKKGSGKSGKKVNFKMEMPKNKLRMDSGSLIK